jgi:NTE family protein
LAEAPGEIAVHVLPTGGGTARDDSPLSYRDMSLAKERIRRAYAASQEYLNRMRS